MNGASLITATKSGAAVKRWLATDDARTRPTHRDAEGESVPVGMPFPVGDALLAFPGDPSGGAATIGEWINCRCTMIFQVADRTPEVFDAELLADEADLDAYEGKALPGLRALGRVVFDPMLHPRDSDGQFAETIGRILDRPDTTPETATVDDRAMLKQTVAVLIADRMKDVPLADLVDAAKGYGWQGQDLADSVTMDVVVRGGGKFTTISDDPEWLKRYPSRAGMAEGLPRLRVGTPEHSQSVRERAVRMLIDAWAASANDNHPTSLAVQHAARVEFDLADAVEWSQIDPENRAGERGVFDKQPEVFRAYVRAMYDETQAWLAEQGITELPIVRGHYLGDKPVPDTVEMRPMSSWTTDLSMAEKFADSTIYDVDGGNKDPNRVKRGVVFKATVPASRVIAIPMTGIGAYHESEVVILGGQMMVSV
jgi:hypothetical protein